MNTKNNNNIDEQNKANFQVCVRIRPLNSKEENQTQKKYHSIVQAQDDMVFVYDPNESSIKDIITYNQSCIVTSNNPSYIGQQTNGINGISNYSGNNNGGVNGMQKRPEKEFIFDYVFDENSTTENVFNKAIQPSVEHIMNGYNSTVFAYGMTGAGKSFTIFGNLYSQANNQDGIALMIIKSIHQKAQETTNKIKFKFSYLEIYNENIRDLMVSKSENLMVIEDPEKGVFVPDLTEYPLEDPSDINNFIIQGNTRRIMASTSANQFSSRSHAIIQIVCEQVNHGENMTIQSKLCIVDLAGSERAASTENRGMRLTEGANINRSLLALGTCINLLSDQNKKGSFVPYRDSKLTRLLKESLGGNTKSIMIACVSPSSLCYEETMNTLKYAVRARKIKKSVKKNEQEMNEHVSEYKNIINGLRNEIINLKDQLEVKNKENMLLKNKQRLLHQYNSNNSVECFDDVNKGNSVDEIGQNLFENLEEHWEIKNTIEEIIDLNRISEKYILEQEEMIEQHSNKLEEHEISEIKNDIEKRQEVILSNQEILVEMNQKLAKNVEQKRELQQKIKNIGTQFQGTSTFNINSGVNGNFSNDVEADLKEFDTNMKDIQIFEMQKKMKMMQEELNQKDLLLQQKQKIIKNLKTGKETPTSGQNLQKKGSQTYNSSSSNNITPSQPLNSQQNSTSSNTRKFYMKIPKEMISDRPSNSSQVVTGNYPSQIMGGSQLQDINKIQQNVSNILSNNTAAQLQSNSQKVNSVKRQHSYNNNAQTGANDENSCLATTKRSNRDTNKNQQQHSSHIPGPTKDQKEGKKPSTSKNANLSSRQMFQGQSQQPVQQWNGLQAKNSAKQQSNQKKQSNNGSNTIINSNIYNCNPNNSGKKMEISISELKQYALKLKNVDFSNIGKTELYSKLSPKSRENYIDQIENFQIMESKSHVDLLDHFNHQTSLNDVNKENGELQQNNPTSSSSAANIRVTSSKNPSPNMRNTSNENTVNINSLMNQIYKKTDQSGVNQQVNSIKALENLFQGSILFNQESSSNLFSIPSTVTNQNTLDQFMNQIHEGTTSNKNCENEYLQGLIKTKGNRSMSCFKIGTQDIELNSYALARKKLREFKDKLTKMSENSDKFSKDEISSFIKEYKISSNYSVKNPEDEQKIKILENHIGTYYTNNSKNLKEITTNENFQPSTSSQSKKSGTYSSHQSSSNVSSYAQQQQLKMQKKEQNSNTCLKTININTNQLPPQPASCVQSQQNQNNSTPSVNTNKQNKKVLPRGLLSQLNSNYAETVTYSKKNSSNNQSSFHQSSSRIIQRDKSPISTKNRDNSRRRVQDTFGQATSLNNSYGIPPKGKQQAGTRDQGSNMIQVYNSENGNQN